MGIIIVGSLAPMRAKLIAVKKEYMRCSLDSFWLVDTDLF
jgi:hypothetical protein